MTDLGGGAGLGPGPPSDQSDQGVHQRGLLRVDSCMDTNPLSKTSEMMSDNTGPTTDDGSVQGSGGPSTAESVSQADGVREEASTSQPETSQSANNSTSSRSFADTVSRIEKFYIHLQKTEEDTSFMLKPQELSRLVHRKFGFPKEAIAGIEQKVPQVITVTTKGIDSKKFETNVAHEVKYGILTYPQKVTERKVKVTLKNIGADTDDGKVKQWLSAFGRPTEDPGIKECFKVRADETDENVKAMSSYFNGDKSYFIFLERNIPTFGYWQDDEDTDQDSRGRRIVVKYSGQPPTCGRCHKTEAQGCKGKANASRCETNGGERIELQDFWRIITSQPTTLPSKDTEENDIRCNAVKINNVHKDVTIEDIRSLLLPAISRLIEPEDIERTRTQNQIIFRNLTNPEANAVLQHVGGKLLKGRTITACLVASLTPSKTSPAEDKSKGSADDLPPNPDDNDDKESDDGNDGNESNDDKESEAGNDDDDMFGDLFESESETRENSVMIFEPNMASTARSSPTPSMVAHGPVNLHEHAAELSVCERCYTMLKNGKCPSCMPSLGLGDESETSMMSRCSQSGYTPNNSESTVNTETLNLLNTLSNDELRAIKAQAEGGSVTVPSTPGAQASGSGIAKPPQKSPMTGFGSVEKERAKALEETLAAKMKNLEEEEMKRKDREIIQEYEDFKKKSADDPNWEKDSLGRSVARDVMGNLIRVHHDDTEEETFEKEKERLKKWKEAKARENKRNKSGLPKSNLPRISFQNDVKQRIVDADKETPDKLPKPGEKRGATSSPEMDNDPSPAGAGKTSKGRGGKKKSKNSPDNSPRKPPARELRTRKH